MTQTAPLILLVDDDADFLAIHAGVLKSGGYRVVCCGDPDEALATISAARPDLVITDLMMKSLDAGFSLAGRIKQDSRFADIPVIIATSVAARAGFDFRPRGDSDLAAMHADAFLEKPIAPQLLLREVARLLHKPAKPGQGS